ncbi:hypothetical protein XELAEV_18035062mg [Xenopus laevis]|uniref:Uncharacterized protein n=1 Tax=Xenopus laevis TaxID=8355 RepID=A0A974CF95_XENLA|nr:hypothetical protein XELAEV_18035062mg [Xenopus laevis]
MGESRSYVQVSKGTDKEAFEVTSLPKVFRIAFLGGESSRERAEDLCVGWGDKVFIATELTTSKVEIEKKTI